MEQVSMDVIEQAAVALNMTRAEFVRMFDGAGDESLAQRATRIVREQERGVGMVVCLMDRGAFREPREPTMNARGKWRFYD